MDTAAWWGMQTALSEDDIHERLGPVARLWSGFAATMPDILDKMRKEGTRPQPTATIGVETCCGMQMREVGAQGAQELRCMNCQRSTRQHITVEQKAGKSGRKHPQQPQAIWDARVKVETPNLKQHVCSLVESLPAMHDAPKPGVIRAVLKHVQECTPTNVPEAFEAVRGALEAFQKEPLVRITKPEGHEAWRSQREWWCMGL